MLKTDLATTGVEFVTKRKNVAPRGLAQKSYAVALGNQDLVLGLGPAGTGKTYLAVAAAVAAYEAGEVSRIILSRPAVEAGERLGFLPGDMKEKVDPYMQPLYDALDEFLGGKVLEKMLQERTVEVSPIAFMRGRTLRNAFIVLDEAQNATNMQMKMFLTRLGEGSRMAVVGDPSQTDLPSHMMSGLAEAAGILEEVEGVSVCRLTGADVVRHPLVSRIVAAYGD